MTDYTVSLGATFVPRTENVPGGPYFHLYIYASDGAGNTIMEIQGGSESVIGAAISDNFAITVKSPPSADFRNYDQSTTIVSGLSEQEAMSLMEGAINAAAEIFSGAEYQYPTMTEVLASPMYVYASISVEGVGTIQIPVPVFSGLSVEFGMDGCFSDCQNSNTVGFFAADYIVNAAAELGIGEIYEFGPGMFSYPVPGYNGDWNNLKMADGYQSDNSEDPNTADGSKTIADEYYEAIAAAELLQSQNSSANVSYSGGNNRNRSVTVTEAPVQETNPITGNVDTVTVTTETYANGSTTVTELDQNGNGTFTSTSGNGSSVVYTVSEFGADMPIILDLDGDGIEVSLEYQASFDYDGDGFRERTAWAAADDAFLVVDLNADGTRGAGDGLIDQQKELVLSAWGAAGATDLQGMRLAA